MGIKVFTLPRENPSKIFVLSDNLGHKNKLYTKSFSNLGITIESGGKMAGLFPDFRLKLRFLGESGAGWSEIRRGNRRSIGIKSNWGSFGGVGELEMHGE